MTGPVLIDTDPGIDDALALVLALRSPEWRLVAVTTVAGNVPVDVGTRNVARILGVGRPEPPPTVAAGAAGPRAGVLVTATHVHGADGLGGLGTQYPEPPLDYHPGDAADLIVASARRWPGALTIVALGPLTNLALALERDPVALARVRAVVAMGGAIGVGGNVTAAAEFNVHVDPESAALVLGAGLPLTLVPLDVTREVVWTRARVARLAGAADPVTRFVHALGRAALELSAASGEGGITMHDPLAVAIALDPTLVETMALPLAVETAGRLTRGMTVGDRRPSGPDRDVGVRCRVALRVDPGRVLRLFEERVWQRSA